MNPSGTSGFDELPGSVRLGSGGRYDCGDAVLGEVPRAARRMIESGARSEATPDAPLAERIRAHVYDHRDRQRYVAAATRYLRAKRPGLRTVYDVIVVGAGMHAALFVYTVKRRAPDLKVLIVEKSEAICSTFSRLGDALVLNSPVFSRVGLNSNVAPGHFVQLSDFDELAERPFPTAKHLCELASMMLFHADADILFDFCVERVDEVGGHYAVSCAGRTAEARSVVVANGMGEQRKDAFVRDERCSQVVDGDGFISACHVDETLHERLRDKTIAVVGAGDTANCVMEHLLPLAYPNQHYSAFGKPPFVPSLVYWIGQSAESVRDFYFANKKRYCHSGGIIEFFWDGDAPFDLPTDAWTAAKARLRCIADKLMSVSHDAGAVELIAGGERLGADIVVDCTGRFNALSETLLRGAYEFIEGDIVLCGGRWDARQDGFVASPRRLHGRRLACKLKGEHIFLIGCAGPLDELVDDAEARDGALKYQEDQQSLTNSKFSLEHTLPRSFAFARDFPEWLRSREP